MSNPMIGGTRLGVFRRNFYALFFVLLLTTEFYYIHIGGGVARIYHFLAVVVVLSLARHVPKLLRSNVLIALLVFVGVNLCAILYSDVPDLALASFLSFSANLSVAMATALILLTRRVELEQFTRIVLGVTLVSILWGLLQIAAYRIAGIDLALSAEQSGQISMGFGPAFRTEANTFGKYMVFAFLLFFPEYIERKDRKHIKVIYLFFMIGIFMNFTRSAVYGMGIALFFIACWYTVRGRLGMVTGRGVEIVAATAIGIALIVGGVLNISEYAEYKFVNILNREEILTGGSSGYRLEMMELIVQNAFSERKKLIVGNGWGQTNFYWHGFEVTAGGGDIVTVLGYSGMLGVAVYLLYMGACVRSAWKDAKASQHLQQPRLAEGVIFALIGIFCTGQMAGYLTTPEYWLLIGLAIYLSLRIWPRPLLVYQPETV